MSTLNDYGGPDPNVDEGIGNLAYDTIEDKAKDKAKDLTKKGVKKAGNAAVNLVDKLTNNSITRAKNAVKRAKEKVKEAVKKLAKEGVQALGHLAVEAVKALGSFIAANPVVAVIIAIILFILFLFMSGSGEEESDLENLQTDNVLLESPVYANVDGMADDDIVVILMDDCVSDSTSSISNEEMITKEKVDRATEVYSVFHTYGFNNASVAGILANADAESGLDPSAIEGIFDEYGVLGTKKAKAFLSIDNYTRTDLFPKYKRSGISLNEAGYKTTDSNGNNVYYCGLGLVQWTGGNAKTLLTAAETMSTSWYNMDFQLAYMLSDNIYRPGFFAGWVADQFTGLTDDDYDDWYDEYTDGMTDEEIDDLDPDEVAEDWAEDVKESWLEASRQSALKFAHDYEGNSSDDAHRMAAAETWYGIIGEWGDADVDSNFSDTITAFASELGAIIEWVDISDAYYRCYNNTIYDNSSLASAGISYAWPKRELSFNNGTALYQTIHDTIMPKDYIYKACDRSVGLAVRWSGTDDDYPVSGTTNQLSYLLSSPKWELVGMASDLTMADLQPGDVFIINGHTFMYVGTDAVQAAYAGEANTTSDSISGSLGERSPGCDTSASSIINRGGQDWNGRGVYYVFRCSTPDNSTKYSSIGTGMSGTNAGMGNKSKTN